MPTFETTLAALMAVISLYVTISAFRLHRGNKDRCCSQYELLLITLMVSGLAGVAYYAAMSLVPSSYNVGLLKHGRDLFNILIPLAFLNVIRQKFRHTGDREKHHVAD